MRMHAFFNTTPSLLIAINPTPRRYTLTTLKTGNKGEYAKPPTPTLFPSNWFDSFESYNISSEVRGRGRE